MCLSAVVLVMEDNTRLLYLEILCDVLQILSIRGLKTRKGISWIWIAILLCLRFILESSIEPASSQIALASYTVVWCWRLKKVSVVFSRVFRAKFFSLVEQNRDRDVIRSNEIYGSYYAAREIKWWKFSSIVFGQ